MHIYMYIKAKIKVFSFSCNAVMDAFIEKWFCLNFVIRLNRIQFTRSGHCQREASQELYQHWGLPLLWDIAGPRIGGFGQTKHIQRIINDTRRGGLDAERLLQESFTLHSPPSSYFSPASLPSSIKRWRLCEMNLWLHATCTAGSEPEISASEQT